jgi:iron-sulfur cluster repair protein YtfE (RIC family)
MPKSLKRHKALQPISREHREILSFCLKIEKGIKKGASIQDMQAYSLWYWTNQLEKHFVIEENILFPVMDKEDPLIQKAINDHLEIANYFRSSEFSYNLLRELAKKIHDHVRYEERKLFQSIQERVSELTLNNLKFEVLDAKSCDWITPFWE